MMPLHTMSVCMGDMLCRVASLAFYFHTKIDREVTLHDLLHSRTPFVQGNHVTGTLCYKKSYATGTFWLWLCLHLLRLFLNLLPQLYYLHK